VSRLCEEDPHAILDMRPARESSAWYGGDKIWECKAAQNLGLSYYNFPLPEEREVIRLEMSCEGPEKMHFSIYAPEGSLSIL